jgi:hypothetical protein
MLEFTDRCTRAFATLNGWSLTDYQFTFNQLAGRTRIRDVMEMPIRRRYGADSVLDHLFWFRRERKPVAVVSMPYHGNREAAQQLAAQYGLIMLAPPIVNAGWARSVALPGENGTECFAFVRPGTEVRWLPGQKHESAYREFVAVFNRDRERREGHVRARSRATAARVQ